MINLYIFNDISRDAIYGIGTYIRELSAALADSEMNVCVVHLRSEKQDENPADRDGVNHLYIPSPITWNASIDWNILNEVYFRNAVYFLRSKIKK